MPESSPADNPVASAARPPDRLTAGRPDGLDAAGVAVAQIDALGTVRGGNDAFFLLSGVSRRNVDRGQVRWVDLLPLTAVPLEGSEGRVDTRFLPAAPWEAELQRADGATVSVLVCGGPCPTRPGDATAVLIELPSRMRSEQRFRSQLACARVLAEAQSPADAAGRLLRPLCWMLGFDGGLLWVGIEGGPLELVGGHFDPDTLPAEQLEEAARAAAAEAGPAGRCRAERRVVWAENLTEYVADPRTPAFRAAGLEAVLVVPIVAGPRVLGALELVARHLDPPDDPLLATLSAIAAQLAQFLEGWRTEAERLALQQRLAQAQKMEAIGRLAGGIAHDFNNLLTIITGYAELLTTDLPAGTGGHEFARQIEAAADRATTLIRQLLTFSRQAVLESSAVDLNDLLRDSEGMIRRLIGEDVRLTTDLAADPAVVRADAGQMHQVVLNLVANARDAMPQGGDLTIATAGVAVDAATAADHPEVPPGRYVRLTVRDTGVGMDEATCARIFEPFFTTKAQGRGTGMGLATVYGIVQASGGQIRVASWPGESTAFHVYLPQAVAGPVGRGAALPGRVPPGRETILLAEDESEVRHLFRRVLAAAGYRVLTAANGREAVELAETFGERIDLLVTDVVMPGMSGRQVAAALQTRQPDLLVLYLSGYTDDAVLRHGVLSAEVAFLHKPVTPTALAAQVRFLLDAAARIPRGKGERS